MKDADFKNMKCMAHTLNLAVQSGLNAKGIPDLLIDMKKIVSYFKRSPVATSLLKVQHHVFHAIMFFNSHLNCVNLSYLIIF